MVQAISLTGAKVGIAAELVLSGVGFNALISGDLDGQDANHAVFAKVEGQAVLDECSGIHDDAKVTDLVEGIEESLAEHADAVALALSRMPEMTHKDKAE